MKLNNLNEMKKGWFVGDFEPTLIRTRTVEAAVKCYRAGDYESSHYHKIATEITVVVQGIIEMNGRQYQENDIIVIEPGERTDFKAITDSKCTVVKYPGAVNDKYID